MSLIHWRITFSLWFGPTLDHFMEVDTSLLYHFYSGKYHWRSVEFNFHYSTLRFLSHRCRTVRHVLRARKVRYGGGRNWFFSHRTSSFILPWYAVDGILFGINGLFPFDRDSLCHFPTRLSPREFGQSPAPFSGLVRPAVYSPGVLAWDGKGLLKLIYVYYGIRENDLRKNDIHWIDLSEDISSRNV